MDVRQNLTFGSIYGSICTFKVPYFCRRYLLVQPRFGANSKGIWIEIVKTNCNCNRTDGGEIITKISTGNLKATLTKRVSFWEPWYVHIKMLGCKSAGLRWTVGLKGELMVNFCSQKTWISQSIMLPTSWHLRSLISPKNCGSLSSGLL